jgi:hypothetical protein
MNGAVLSADDERGFGPGLHAHPVGQVLGAHHAEEAEKGAFPFAENDRTAANDGELGGFGGIVNALFLFGRGDRKNAREESTGREPLDGNGAIISDVTAHFEAARDLLRVIAFNAAPERKIGRTAEGEIKFFIGLENVRIAEVGVTNVETILKAVPLDGFAREPNALFLRFNRDEARKWQTPGGDQRDSADSTAEIECVTSGGAPGCAVPGSEDVVRGKTMAILQLEDAEVAANRIQGLTGFERWPFATRARRDGAGFGPTAKTWIEPVHLHSKRLNPLTLRLPIP